MLMLYDKAYFIVSMILEESNQCRAKRPNQFAKSYILAEMHLVWAWHSHSMVP